MIDLSTVNSIYIVGIAGAGMSGIATMLHEEGFSVSGSDMKSTDYMKYLEKIGIMIYDSDDLSVIQTVDCVLVSSAVPESNPLIQEAHKHTIPVITRHTVFTYWSSLRSIFACSGCHGKTTTTAMLSHMYPEYGRLIGVQHKNSAHSGLAGTPLIIEADEYAKTFLSLYPKIALVTNIERDHVGIYPTDESYIDTFRQFLNQTIEHNGCLVMCGDESNSFSLSREFADTTSCITYGFNMKNDVVIARKETGTFSLIMNPQSRYYTALSHSIVTHCHDISLTVIGSHNMLNAAGCILVSILHELGIELVQGDITRLSEQEYMTFSPLSRMESFVNVSRRQEYMGQFRQSHALWYDDYAHTPTEILETIKAFKEHFTDKKLIVFFQPHSLERFNGFYPQFIDSFTYADEVYITDIFITRGEEYEGGEGELEMRFVQDIQRAYGMTTDYIPMRSISTIHSLCDDNTILLSLNAGTLRGVIERIQ